MWINTLWTFIKARYSVKTKRKLEDFHFISFLIFAPTLYYIKINCCRSFFAHFLLLLAFFICFSVLFGRERDWLYYPIFGDSFHFVIELLCTCLFEASDVCLLLLVSLLLFYFALLLLCFAFGFAFSHLLSIYSFSVWDLAVNLQGIYSLNVTTATGCSLLSEYSRIYMCVCSFASLSLSCSPLSAKTY